MKILLIAILLVSCSPNKPKIEFEEKRGKVIMLCNYNLINESVKVCYDNGNDKKDCISLAKEKHCERIE